MIEGASEGDAVERLLEAAREERKSMMRLTIMVAGMSGLGKSTCINSLFNRTIIPKKGAIMDKTKEITSYAKVINSTNTFLSLTVIDTVGYGETAKLTTNTEAIKQEVLTRARRHAKNQLSAKQSLHDATVDLILYFIDPHRFKPIDEDFVMELAELAPIAIVMAKADTMTPRERGALKDIVTKRLAKRSRGWLTPPDIAPTGPFSNGHLIFGGRPFAVICEDREYSACRWEVENPDHSDFPDLRTRMLLTETRSIMDASKAMYDKLLLSNSLGPSIWNSKSEWNWFIMLFLLAAVTIMVGEVTQVKRPTNRRVYDLLAYALAIAAGIVLVKYFIVNGWLGHADPSDELYPVTKEYSFEDYKMLVSRTNGRVRDEN